MATESRCWSPLNRVTRESANFITRSGTKLKDGGQDFYFVGANAYWLVDAASYSGRNYRIPIFFEKAKAMGLKVVRTWAFNHGSPSTPSYGSNTLVYNAREVAGLDSIIQQEGQNQQH
ncbi:mannan endo-1,4-beta-mannosidase [Haematococcus lacustris]|uniref:Mannan endo-1,4-beta-mannosidase n=1 Tax=Haematococcus lacustris TaxID=44745 RepID=A0A699YI35_HAELA|nr:mannan endo-1,4-beta-mannosidase [Haematococcus lacustris]